MSTIAYLEHELKFMEFGVNVKKGQTIILMILILSGFVFSSSKVEVGRAQSQNHTVYLPLISINSSCQLSEQEQALAELLINDPNQQRAVLQCDPILAQVARERAVDMGNRNYFGHTNPDGYGPNFLVQQAGYILPAYYDQSDDGNNIESICGGSTTPLDAWNRLMSSQGHRTHLLGLDPFFAAQTDYGIGYAYIPDSQYGHYWVIITAWKGP